MCKILNLLICNTMRTILTVRDCQLVDNIPVEKLLIHDVLADIICTPTQVIFKHARPFEL